ncbi:oviduct-specific glycoprotein [Callospermophilus lateralis]
MGKLWLWVGAAYKLVCYFTNWAPGRPESASIFPHDLDPFLCTHLIFAFASMSNNQIVPETPQDEKILYPQFNKLKERNRELKTLLSIGGWNFGTLRFTSMLHSFSNREKFINSAISLLRAHNFDGLDLFFLYPGLRNSPTHDRWKFLFLIEELLSAFQKEALLTNRPRLLLSAAVSGVPHIIQTSYDVNLLGRLLDFINVLSYDFHGSWEKFTGHNSPLYSFPEDPKSSAYAMNYWRKLGAPSEKLMMGFPTYGRAFRLLEPSDNGLQAVATGPASSGKYTKQAGILAYYEICSFLEKARKDWIGYQHVPYAYKGKEWVGYDDIRSFQEKAKFVKEEHLGGAMVWTLDMDDVKGAFCGSGPFPLLYTLNYLLLQDGKEGRGRDPVLCDDFLEISSTPLPQFGFSSAMNSSVSDSERLAVTKALSTDIINIFSPQEEKLRLLNLPHKDARQFCNRYGNTLAHIIFAMLLGCNQECWLPSGHGKGLMAEQNKRNLIIQERVDVKVLDAYQRKKTRTHGYVEAQADTKLKVGTVKILGLVLDSLRLSEAVEISTTAHCKTVISSAIDFLHQDGFDGMNLDIEHSEFWGSPTEDKQQFAILSNLRMESQLCEIC